MNAFIASTKSALARGVAVRIGILCLVGGVLAACQGTTADQERLTLADFDYQKRHPIILSEEPENFDIPLAGGTRNLNRQVSSTILAFGQQAREEGNGYVEVLVPRGSANEAAAKAVTPQIRSALKKGGVSPSKVVVRTYPVNDSYASAPIRLSFARMKAKVPHRCGQWPENVVSGPENTNMDNFGCATQANLAAMVDNPADLLTPRAESPVDAEQRRSLNKKYRTGAITAGDYKEGVGARVSSF